MTQESHRVFRMHIFLRVSIMLSVSALGVTLLTIDPPLLYEEEKEIFEGLLWYITIGAPVRVVAVYLLRWTLYLEVLSSVLLFVPAYLSVLALLFLCTPIIEITNEGIRYRPSCLRRERVFAWIEVAGTTRPFWRGLQVILTCRRRLDLGVFERQREIRQLVETAPKDRTGMSGTTGAD